MNISCSNTIFKGLAIMAPITVLFENNIKLCTKILELSIQSKDGKNALTLNLIFIYYVGQLIKMYLLKGMSTESITIP